MDKIILNKQQVGELVFQNRYPVSENKFLSRCIDGRYPNEKNLPALAIPGADLGELGLVLAAGNNFGFEVDGEKTFETLVKIIDGEENFHFHTGCGHWRQLQSDPAAYHLETGDIKFINSILIAVASKIEKSVVLQGEHREGAILMVKGNYGIYPRFFLPQDEVQVFVYQQSLVDVRHRRMAKKLIENKAVKLYPGCDEEYLYQVLSETAESHLFETLKRLAKGLPIFKVEFEEDGGFEIEEMGKVI